MKCTYMSWNNYFYPRFKFYFILFLGKVMYDNYNEFETKENKN